MPCHHIDLASSASAFSPQRLPAEWDVAAIQAMPAPPELVLLQPVSIPQEGRTLTMPDGRTVHVYCLHALHADEMRLKLEKGTNALLWAFDREHVSEVLQLRRKSSVQPLLDF